MRVIVTGGTGLLGRQLVKSLARDGHEVIVLSRSPKQTEPMPETVSLVQWDAKTAAGWGHWMDGADAVVNLAGASIAGDGFLPSRWTDERKKRILNSRVDAGKAVVEAILNAAQKPKVVFQSSAVGYYGTHPFTKEITEDHPAGDDFLADVCKQWEASTKPVEAAGVRQVITRTGVVLSTKGGALTRLALPYKLFVGGPIGSGKQPVPWIHEDDEIGAIRFLLEHPQASGAYNLCAPNPVTNSEFGRTLGDVLKRPSLIPVPGFAFHLAFGEVATIITEGQRAVPNRLLEAGYDFKFTDLKAALTDLYSANRETVAA